VLAPIGRLGLPSHSADPAFGSVILGARKARGLRQTDLAELSGVTPADISRIERGQVAPTTQTLLKLTTALGVQIQFVLTEAGTASQESISLRVPVAGCSVARRMR
jgi:transcriptional regulator with XRE-family HTH domain